MPKRFAKPSGHPDWYSWRESSQVNQRAGSVGYQHFEFSNACEMVPPRHHRLEDRSFETTSMRQSSIQQRTIPRKQRWEDNAFETSNMRQSAMIPRASMPNNSPKNTPRSSRREGQKDCRTSRTKAWGGGATLCSDDLPPELKVAAMGPFNAHQFGSTSMTGVTGVLTLKATNRRHFRPKRTFPTTSPDGYIKSREAQTNSIDNKIQLLLQRRHAVRTEIQDIEGAIGGGEAISTSR
jgi:hypothetical protein